MRWGLLIVLLALTARSEVVRATQPYVPANLSPLAQQPFLYPYVPPMPGPKLVHSPQPTVHSRAQVVTVGGTNVTIQIVPPADPRANAFNFYWTTDDVAYFYLGTSADGTITLSNQVGTNYYSATAVDTNGVYLESDYSGDLQDPPWVYVPVTNFVVSWGTVRNVTLQECANNFRGWFNLTNVTGTNAIVQNEWLLFDDIRAVTTDRPPVVLQIAPQ